jgi:hypothetical protein
MEMTPVTSSNVKRVGHDPATNKLRVEFHSGATWEYDDVPASHHAAMTDGDASVGKYFHANVKSKFQGRQVDK